MHLTVRINDETRQALQELKKVLLTDNDSYVIRLGIHKLADFFLGNSTLTRIANSDIAPTINLPGMTENVIRGHLVRFNLSSDEYQTIVRDLVDRCAASKTPIKNPEGMIFGACKRYAAERDAKKDGGQPQKGGGNKPSWLEIQDAQN